VEARAQQESFFVAIPAKLQLALLVMTSCINLSKVGRRKAINDHLINLSLLATSEEGEGRGNDV
jgi:hypothetical protein